MVKIWIGCLSLNFDFIRLTKKQKKTMNLKSYIASRLTLLDENTLEVVKKSSGSLVVKIGGMIAGFAVSIILGRAIGPEGLGIINLANRIVGIVLILAMLGMNNVILKEIAIAFERKNWQYIANVIYTSLRINVPLALGFSLLFIFLTPWLTKNVFNEPALKIPLIIALAVVLPQVLSRVFASGVNGFRKIWQSSLVSDTLSMCLIISGLLILLLLRIEITIIRVAVIFAIARVIVTFAIGTYWKQLFQFKGKRKLQIRPMLKVALPLLLISASNIIASNTDAIMLGWLSDISEVGFYNVAFQLGLLTSFFHIIVSPSITPKVASLYEQGKHNELQKMIKQITKVLGLLGLLSLLFFIVTGKWLLNLWGEEFSLAYIPLIIICIGQFFNIATGSTGIILIMTGFEKVVGYLSIFSVLTNVSLNYVLIPKYGAVGAATTTAVTIFLSNLIKFILVYKKTGIIVLPFNFK